MTAARSLLVVLTAMTIGGGAAASSPKDFYRGKTLRIVVGSSPGGGYDTDARLVARHLPRHVPGHPRVVVDNMAGAGGLIAANAFGRTIAPDGLSVAYVPTGVVTAQLLGSPGVHFDLRRFEILGSAYPDRRVCVFPAERGIATLDDWKASPRPLRLGSTGVNSGMSIFPAMLAATLDLPLQIVTGYRGTTEVRFGIVSGELDGACLTWSGIATGWPGGRGLAVVTQGGLTAHPELAHVPLAWTLSTTPEARELLGTVIEALAVSARFYALPGGTPVERRDLLRQALTNTFSDPAYVRDARQAGVPIEPMHGDEVALHLDALLALAPESLTRLREALTR